MTFFDLGLAEPICRAVAADGYTTPTPIQTQAIPQILRGGDLIGCAQTGTGKTGAFALPILHRLNASKASQKGLRVLVLAPTRELASQINESFRAYGRFLKLRTAVVFGGVNQFHQVRALKQNPEILIATPGRLLDLMNQGFINLQSLEVLVLDEADRMLDMGFIHDIRKIIKQVPKKRQTLFFSATMPDEIRALADSILHQPMMVRVDPIGSTARAIEQSVYFVMRKSKSALLKHVLTSREPERALVFTRTKHGADKVVKDLLRFGFKAVAIHGNKSQNARTAALNSFKSNHPPVLVATDIASRGIDVDNISLVINFDVPHEPESYVHRIGRTARAGAAGVAISFCDQEERGDLRQIERLTQQRISVNTDAPKQLESAAPPVMTHEKPAERPREHKPTGDRRQQQRHHAPKQHHPRSSDRKPEAAGKKHHGFGQRGRSRRKPAGFSR